MKININYIESHGWEAEICGITNRKESLEELMKWVLATAEVLVERDRRYREALTIIQSGVTVEEFRKIIERL